MNYFVYICTCQQFFIDLIHFLWCFNPVMWVILANIWNKIGVQNRRRLYKLFPASELTFDSIWDSFLVIRLGERAIYVSIESLGSLRPVCTKQTISNLTIHWFFNKIYGNRLQKKKPQIIIWYIKEKLMYDN